MSSLPVLSTLCPFEPDTVESVTILDRLYPPTKVTPMTPAELEEKVHAAEQESRSITPPKIPGYKHVPVTEDAIQREEFEEKLQSKRNDLLTTPAINGNPVLYTKDGVRVFTGIFASEEPFRYAVEHDHSYEGVQTYTVNGITFTVDFRNYSVPFVA